MMRKDFDSFSPKNTLSNLNTFKIINKRKKKVQILRQKYKEV